MAFNYDLHHYLLSSSSGLSPWRVPAGDGVAGQLPPAREGKGAKSDELSLSSFGLNFSHP